MDLIDKFIRINSELRIEFLMNSKRGKYKICENIYFRERNITLRNSID